MSREYRSHTQLTTTMRCTRKFHYAYVQGLKKHFAPTPLAMGSWMHTCMEADAIGRGIQWGSLLVVPEQINLDQEWAEARIDPLAGAIDLVQTIDDETGERIDKPLKTFRLDWRGAHQMMLFLAKEEMPEGVIEGWMRDGRWVPQTIEEMLLGYHHHHREKILRERPLLVEQRGSVVIDGVRFEFRFDEILLEGSLCILRDWKSAKQKTSGMTRLVQGQRMLYGVVANHAPSIQKILKRKVAALELDYLKSAPATRPSQNQDGAISKKKINTTAVVYAQALIEMDKDPTLSPHREIIEAFDEEDNFFWRDRIPYHPESAKRIIKDYLNADMVASQIETGALAPTRDVQQSCDWQCDFKDLCVADLYGQDTRGFLTQFEKREDVDKPVDLEDYEELQA